MSDKPPLSAGETLSEWAERAWQARREQEPRNDTGRVPDNGEVVNPMALAAEQVGDLLAEETDRSLLVADQQNSASRRNTSAQFLVQSSHACSDAADPLMGRGVSNQPVSP